MLFLVIISMLYMYDVFNVVCVIFFTWFLFSLELCVYLIEYLSKLCLFPCLVPGLSGLGIGRSSTEGNRIIKLYKYLHVYMYTHVSRRTESLNVDSKSKIPIEQE